MIEKGSSLSHRNLKWFVQHFYQASGYFGDESNITMHMEKRKTFLVQFLTQIEGKVTEKPSQADLVLRNLFSYLTDPRVLLLNSIQSLFISGDELRTHRFTRSAFTER